MAKKRRSSGQGTLFKRKPDGPWIAAWYDHAGKRRARSTRTTDRRAGVAPQLAQKIMRHADYKTTLKHYTVLGVADTANAINQLPHIQQKQHEAATGTCDETPRKACILKQQQLAHETKQISAIRCDGDERENPNTDDCKYFRNASLSDNLQGNANRNVKAGERIRTADVQLGKLAFYH
jgi:hypothetical protein